MLKFGLSFLLLLLIFQQSLANAFEGAETRDKRSLDLGLVIRSLLQKSGELSSAKVQTKVAAKPARTTTTAKTTTTTAAPTTAPATIAPFFYKAFIKPIPFVGKLGFEFNAGGNLVQRPPFNFAFNSPPTNNGYINFDYTDVADAPVGPTTTTAPSTTTPRPPTKAPKPTAPRQQRPKQQQSPRPTQPNRQSPPKAPTPQPQRNVKIIYQYVPAPQLPAAVNTAAHGYFPNSPINSNYGGQLTNYENPHQFYDTQLQQQLQYQSAIGQSLQSQSPFAAQQQQRAKTKTPQAAAANAQQATLQLNDNLVYQYAQPDDIYIRNEPAENAPNDDQSSANDVDAASPGDDSNNDEAASDDDKNNVPESVVTSAPPATADVDEPNGNDYADDNNNYVPSNAVDLPSSTLAPAPKPSSQNYNNDYVDEANTSDNSNGYEYVFQNDAYPAISSAHEPQSQLYNYQDAAIQYENNKAAHASPNTHTPGATVAPEYVKIRFVPVTSTPKSTLINYDYVDVADAPNAANDYKYVSNHNNKNIEVPNSKPQAYQLYSHEHAALQYDYSKPAAHQALQSSFNDSPTSTVTPDYAKIRFVPVSSTQRPAFYDSDYAHDADIAKNLNYYKYERQQPYSHQQDTPAQYDNSQPEHRSSPSAYSSSRFHRSFVNYHSPSSSSSYSYTNGHP